jgi:hypothetical protein
LKINRYDLIWDTCDLIRFSNQITSYLELEKILPTNTTMAAEVFWATEGSAYPRLRHLARRLLSIPASSDSVERLFSITGAILSARRNHLSATTVESLLLRKQQCEFGLRQNEKTAGAGKPGIISGSANESHGESEAMSTLISLISLI